MTFEDPILAGEILIRDSIQSEGFLAGSAGWKISRNGNAEFNDATVRGELIVANGSGDSVQIGNYFGAPSILFHDNGTLKSQTLWSNGLLVLLNGGRVDQFHQLDKWTLYSQVDGFGVTFDRVTGYWKASAGSGGTLSEWTNLTLSGGWTNDTGTTWDALSYKRMPDGTVRLRGVIFAGTKTDGTVVATLPAGLRPTKRKQLGLSSDAAGATPGAQIFTNGEIQIVRVGAAGALVFDGLSFELV